MYNENRYYAYLTSIIDQKRVDDGYIKLIRFLFNKPFYCVLEEDENRVGDGMTLREDFGVELNRPCSVLELMIGVAKRMEHILHDSFSGDNTDKWFWEMIYNLGLEECTDDNFEEGYVTEIVDIFIDREYDFDGTGGLFPLQNAEEDLTKKPVWYQINLYVLENY